MRYMSFVPTSKMASGKVTDKFGEPYGHITDFLVDPSNGKIALAVLSFGGLLGIGDTHKVIPFTALQMNPNTFDYQINIDKDVIEKAPEMDANDVTDYKKMNDLFKYYGMPAYWDQSINFDTTDPVYKDIKTNDHQQYEGSYQISDPRRTPEGNNQFTEDIDANKLEGKPSTKS